MPFLSNPPPHESESNGSVENGVKLFKGMLRVHLLALERKLKGNIPSQHPVMTWLVECVADIVTKYMQGADGRTSYERLFGKQVHEEGLEFGERVWWRRHRSNDMNVVLDARWAEGVWLGRRWGTIHHRVAVNDEVLEVRAVQRRPLAERWCRESLGNIRAVPWKNPAPLLDEVPPVVLPPLPDVEPAARVPAQPEFAPRRVYIRHADLEKWGYTSNCRRCMQMRRGYKAAGVPHTAACRDQIERSMADVGDPRLAHAEERLTEFLEDKIAEGDPRTQSGSSGSDNPIQAEEECIPCVPSESDGNHPQSSSSSSSACAPTSDNEVRPNPDNDLDDRDAMIDFLCPDSVFALESPNTEVLPEVEGTNVRDETENLAVWGARKYWDAITQEELPAELTRAARQEELDFMQDWHVWDVVPVAESWSVTGKAPLQGKWVDVNKGDLERPVVRSRYVAKEFANTKSDDFFSPTPPLEALRLLLSHAASGRSSSTGGRKILVVDARKAHLHAFAERNLYVALPPEVRVPGMCARLRRSLYGTRDAPARWEAFLSKQLEGKGFVRGSASPCCYRHSSKDLSCVVHGDDFVFAGVESDLEWARQQMEKSFLVKVIGRLGGDKQDVRELRVLNRVLSWRSGGIQLEADPRHQEILISELEQGVHGLSTPGVKNPQRKDGDGDGAESLLNEAEAHSFRSTAARASYLALDRPDLAFATKELCRRMSSPTKADVSALGCPAICYSLTAWCTSSCGNLKRIWMCLWTRISRDA